MPQNDPALDAINYGGAARFGTVEFDTVLFEDIEESDLFWFSDNINSDINHAFRKLDNTSAMDTRNRTLTENINVRRKVYQKT